MPVRNALTLEAGQTAMGGQIVDATLSKPIVRD